MRNEILLIVSLVVLYAMVLLWYQLFGRSGMYCFTVFATIAANIEVLLLVDAFGMEMTLGNILFATTFLVTDILSETEGKKAAQKAGAELIVIARPKEEGKSLQEVKKLMEEFLAKENLL